MVVTFRVLPLAVLAVVGVLAGCGGGSRGDDGAQVRAVIHGYAMAVIDRDGVEQCRYMAWIARVQATGIEGAGAGDCPAVAGRAYRGWTRADRARVVGEATSVTIRGNRAVARIRTGGGDFDLRRLVKEDGVWRLAG
jgi:hypothetical protein